MSESIAPLILEKLATLFLLIGVGGAARRSGLINEAGERTISTLLVDIFWPALIFSSITGNLSRADLLRNLSLPGFALVTVAFGWLLGLIGVRLMGYRDDRRRCFIFQSMFNNFVFMVLPFALLFIPERGAGLLFIHNLGMILALWIVGVPILQGENKAGPAERLKSLLTNPGIIATVSAMILVLSGLNTRLPNLAVTTLETLGAPTMAIAMMAAGSRIAGMGLGALRFDLWNMLLAFIRLLFLPLVLLGLAMAAWTAGLAGPETLIIFTLVNIVPVGVFSVSLANRFGSSPELMAESVTLTHIIGAGTMILWLLLMQKLPFFP